MNMNSQRLAVWQTRLTGPVHRTLTHQSKQQNIGFRVVESPTDAPPNHPMRGFLFESSQSSNSFEACCIECRKSGTEGRYFNSSYQVLIEKMHSGVYMTNMDTLEVTKHPPSFVPDFFGLGWHRILKDGLGTAGDVRPARPSPHGAPHFTAYKPLNLWSWCVWIFLDWR